MMEIRYSKQAVKINFSSWDDIEEIIPDDIDISMLNDINANPECKQFASSADVMNELGL